MTREEHIKLIDDAIDEIMNNLAKGILISRYTIGQTTIEKRNPLELLETLHGIKAKIVKAGANQGVQFVF